MTACSAEQVLNIGALTKKNCSFPCSSSVCLQFACHSESCSTPHGMPQFSALRQLVQLDRWLLPATVQDQLAALGHHKISTSCLHTASSFSMMDELSSKPGLAIMAGAGQACLCSCMIGSADCGWCRTGTSCTAACASSSTEPACSALQPSTALRPSTHCAPGRPACT